MANRTLPLLMVSIKVPTKTRPPLTATSLYRPSVIRSARLVGRPWIVIVVLRLETGLRFRTFLAIEVPPAQAPGRGILSYKKLLYEH